MTDNWKKLIFENEHETLFETDDIQEMYNFIGEMHGIENLIFENIYESMNYYTIHFAGYNLMIKK